jgi:hypothetical protein
MQGNDTRSAINLSLAEYKFKLAREKVGPSNAYQFIGVAVQGFLCHEA